MGKRKRYAAEFKAKVASEALRGGLTTARLATKHGMHQTMINERKRQTVEGLASVFSGKAEAKEGIREGELEKPPAPLPFDPPAYARPPSPAPASKASV